MINGVARRLRDLTDQALFLYYCSTDGVIPFDYSAQATILLHGYTARQFTMYGLANYLAADCLNPFLVNYPFWRGEKGIREYLYPIVDSIADRTAQPVRLVGHSLGGLVGVDLAQEKPTLVDRVVALGAPFSGTMTAYIHFLIPGCRLMVPGNAFLERMKEKGFPSEVTFISMYTTLDSIILPSDSARLLERDNVKNVEVSHVGHLGLIGPKCYTIVEGLLR